ncbi:MAG: cyanophycin synthetase [Candidatus Babeliales bacterium]
MAAIAVATELGIPLESTQKALANFSGIDRRFSFKGVYRDVEIFDDYGHHPVEIENTLLVARKRAKGNLIVLFQPHRFTRTQKLWDHFINTFLQSDINHLIITDIYPASEEAIEGISSLTFVEALKQHNPSFKVTYIRYEKDFNEMQTYLNTILAKNDLLLLLGAGKINKIAPVLINSQS